MANILQNNTCLDKLLIFILSTATGMVISANNEKYCPTRIKEGSTQVKGEKNKPNAQALTKTSGILSGFLCLAKMVIKHPAIKNNVKFIAPPVLYPDSAYPAYRSVAARAVSIPAKGLTAKNNNGNAHKTPSITYLLLGILPRK